MKKIKIGLLARIVIAIILGIAIGTVFQMRRSYRNDVFFGLRYENTFVLSPA